MAYVLHSNMTYGVTCRQFCRADALRVARTSRAVSRVILSIIAVIPPIDFITDESAKKNRGGLASKEEDSGRGDRRRMGPIGSVGNTA